MSHQNDIIAALKWHMDIGADAALAEHPVNRLNMPGPALSDMAAQSNANAVQTAAPPAMAEKPRGPAGPTPPKPQSRPAGESMGTAEAVLAAREIASGCQSLQELSAAIEGFDGLGIKATASRMVFADGDAKSDLMFIGEAPGADEDIQGLPFVGRAGQLLNRMLAAANLPRETVYITNVLNWRPPGNRTPSPQEMEVARPFLERHIELMQPKILIFLGGTAVKALLETRTGITRLHGKWHDFEPLSGAAAVPALPTFHPAYLLRSPAAKRSAWQDFMILKARMRDMGIA